MTTQQRGFLTMALGFAVWIGAFSMLYALQATGCARSWQHAGLGSISLLRIMLLALFATSMALLLLLLVRSRRALSAGGNGVTVFLWRASAALTLGAVAAMIWIGMTLVLPSMCR